MVLLFDQNNIPENVFEIVFSTTQQKIVGKVLVDFMKQNNGEINKMKLSLFATKLNDGEVITEIEEEPYKGKKVKLSYNKRQFYDRILTPMRAMGLIDYDLYKKTYKISGDFSNALKHIGEAWQEELGKNPLEVKFGKIEF